MKYVKEKDKIWVKLEVGDLVHKSLETLGDKLGIKSALITGIGVFADPEVGVLDINLKKYHTTTFQGNWEVTNLTGNLTLKDGKSFAHSHLTMVGRAYNAVGGHLIEATVSGAAEFLLICGESDLGRAYADCLGIYLWDIGE